MTVVASPVLATVPPTRHRTDVLIIGAGPVGLFAAFQAGVIGLDCHVIDTLPSSGGQCIELYPDKPIFDIPAIPVCTARELVERLLEQCRPFGTPIHLEQRATTLEQRPDGRFTVATDGGLEFDVAALLIAAGNGAFIPQRLALPDVEALEGSSVHYAVGRLADFADANVVVAGGGDAALDWALALRGVARRVALVHRRDVFRATDSTVRQMRDAVAAGQIDLHIGTIGALHAQPALGGAANHPLGRAAGNSAATALAGIELKQRDGSTRLDAEHLLVLYGLVAELGPIGGWGLELHGGRIVVDTSGYQSSRPGIFAAGDIATYPNKQKLILSGFHEASLALRRAYGYAYPDKTRTHVHSSYDAALAEKILGASDTPGKSDSPDTPATR